ncbi:hypothetical protein EDD16DRAFT_1517867 [Pisolithus croceorrhizus]|nr:hypothetical protein EV401DRAFT_1864023 [Pisolithus croceorrhizus]KAI6123691.1 hypothetical protein EDD16DRAFT_1517867 [Pisolithus croceorrhizus]
MDSVETSQADTFPFGRGLIQIVDVPPLDPGIYSLTPDEAQFFKAATGINDDNMLRTHILSAQEKAYKVAPYPCILDFAFVRMWITKQPVYQDILDIGRERPDAIFLDLGCCFSVDSRKLALDGFPARGIISSDIKKEFLELSHFLFRTSNGTWAGHSVQGGVLDPEMLSVAPITRGSKVGSLPDLSALTSLNPLHGHCSVINVSCFLHLFTEEQQLHLARALAGLLSPEPGSLICGTQFSKKEKGSVTTFFGSSKPILFCHSPESWMELWDGIVFEKGEVEVKVNTQPFLIAGQTLDNMVWSVRRL